MRAPGSSYYSGLLAVFTALGTSGCETRTLSEPVSFPIEVPHGTPSTGPTGEPAPEPSPRVQGFLDGADANGAVGWALSAEASLSVELYLDGDRTSGGLLGSVIASDPRGDVNAATGVAGNHGFHFAFPDSLFDGAPHTITAYGIGPAGAVELSGSPRSFALTPPGSAPTAAISGGPAGDTNIASPSFPFTGSGQGLLSFVCSMDELAGGVPGPCTSPKTYSKLPDGLHTFRVLSVDRYGRRSATQLVRFNVDTSAPAVSIDARPEPATTATGATIRFSSQDGKSGIKGFECKRDAEAFAACTSPKAYSGLSVGAHTFDVRAQDGAGNWSPSVRVSWTIQTPPPPPPPPDGPLKRVGDTVGITVAPGVGPIRFPDLAYDSAHDVYLVVTGNNVTGGTFVSSAGAPIGASFAINSTSPWTQGQRVAYSAAVDAFFVTWHDTRSYNGNQSEVWGRLLAYDPQTGGPRFLGPDFRISEGTSHAEHPGTTMYSPVSGEFLVTWQTVAGFDIHGRRLGPDGSLRGTEIVFTNDSNWQTDPDVALHPLRNEYLVVWATESGGAAQIVGQRLQAGTGAMLGAPILIAVAGGTWIPDVEYIPERDQYLVSWWQGGVFARLLNADGVPVSDVFPIAPGFGSYDNYSLAYNAATGRLAAVFCSGSDYEIWATVVDPATRTFSAPTPVTSVPGNQGIFYPKVVSHGSRSEWMLVGSQHYAYPLVQRFSLK